MEENRISVYGKDAEDKEKRAFDLILIDGQPYVETVSREGHKIKTPAIAAVSAIKRLRLTAKHATA